MFSGLFFFLYKSIAWFGGVNFVGDDDVSNAGDPWSTVHPPACPRPLPQPLRTSPVKACSFWAVNSLFEPYETHFARRKPSQRQARQPGRHAHRHNWGLRSLPHPHFDHSIPCPLRAPSCLLRLSLAPPPASMSSNFKDLLWVTPPRSPDCTMP